MKKLVLGGLVMNKLSRFYDLNGLIVGILILLSAVMMIAEIVYRSAFGKTFFVVTEYAGYMMAVISFWGLSFGEYCDAHIRIDFIDKIRNERARFVITKIRYFAGFVFSLYLTYVLFLLFRESYLYKAVSLQVSETPLAIPQFFMVLGAFFLMTIVAYKLVVKEN
jgi:TRAP-type C4-dicarboxylate transport system permease small subunit